MIDPTSVITHSSAQISCELAGEAAILHLADGVYYGLDEIGAVVWRLLAEPTTIDRICAAILADYDVTPEQCRQDVDALVEELHARGLIEIRSHDARR